MTPDERQLISDLFDRMRQQGRVEKDRDAERLISDSVRQNPDAGYLLVQSVLAQEHYLQQAGSRIEELEGRMRDLEDEIARLQQQPQKSSGSFLGGLFGGGRQEPQPAPVSRSGSVPSFGAGRGVAASPASSGSYGQPGSPWGRQQPQQGGYAQGGGYGQQPMAQQPARGGGFMASALTTAAGVAGGMLAANAISGMLKGDSSAQAAGHPPSTGAGAQEASPYEVNSDADRQREQDWAQDAAQDQEIEQASLDDSADWGSSDDSDI